MKHRSIESLDDGNKIRQSTRPCIHPTCRGDDGNPRLTQDIMCEGCRDQFTRDLDLMVDDYDYLREHQPRPVSSDMKSKSNAGTLFAGEWASSQCSEIWGILRAAAESILSIARVSWRGPDIRASEAARVHSTHKFLSPRIDTLVRCEDGGEIAGAMRAKHRELRSALGYTRRIERFPQVICYRCEVAGGVAREADTRWCESCGTRINDHMWRLMLRETMRQIRST